MYDELRAIKLADLGIGVRQAPRLDYITAYEGFRDNASLEGFNKIRYKQVEGLGPCFRNNILIQR